MFEDISNAIKATLYERVSSPFISSFILSWCVFNYKILFILFSNMETRYKFYEIEVLQLQPQSLLWVDLPFYPYTFLYPFITAAFYTLAFPFIEVGLTYVWMKGQQKVKSTKIKIEDATPVSQERYTALLKKIRQMDRDYAEDLANKDEKCLIDIEIEKSKTKAVEDELEFLNKSLLAIKKEMENSVSSYETEIQKLVNKNNEIIQKYTTAKPKTKESLELDIISRLVNAPDFRSPYSGFLQGYSNGEKLEAERIIDEITDNNLCEFVHSQGKDFIALTKAGKEHYENLTKTPR